MVKELFDSVIEEAIEFQHTLPDRQVGVTLSLEELKLAVNNELPVLGESSEIAIRELISSVEKGLVIGTGPRFFGFVRGGATETSIAADWLTSLWDQNAAGYNNSPAASIIESVVADWILDLLGLPKDSGVGFVTGAQMANFTALTVGRNTVMKNHGWDIDELGLQGAPHIRIVVGASCHATIHSAIRMMGLGKKNVAVVNSDHEGRMEPGDLEKELQQSDGPTIICSQAGNVNTGAFDPIDEIVSLSKKYKAWLHVDGAFGLWAAVSQKYKHLLKGVEGADSWATDAHKWLNVPYDSGLVIIRDKDKHSELKAARCAYAGPVEEGKRDGSMWVPENSRRARGFVLYASLRNLGRKGVEEIVDNCCTRAKEFAEKLETLSYVRIVNKVVLNQVLCRLEPENIEDYNSFNRNVAARIQAEGVCWIGTSIWHGKTVLRISIVNNSTSAEDVERSVQSIQKSVEDELFAAKNNIRESNE